MGFKQQPGISRAAFVIPGLMFHGLALTIHPFYLAFLSLGKGQSPLQHQRNVGLSQGMLQDIFETLKSGN